MLFLTDGEKYPFLKGEVPTVGHPKGIVSSFGLPQWRSKMFALHKEAVVNSAQKPAVFRGDKAGLLKESGDLIKN